MKVHNGLLFCCASGMLFAATGCASTPPPRELLDARAAYQQAKAGPADQLTPASLHEAKVALARAERAYSRDADNPLTRDIAYIAERKAQLAAAEGSAAASKQQAQMAIEQARAAQNRAAQNTRGQLAQARQQLATTSEELEQERQALQEAEKRSQDALNKLAETSANMVKKEPRGTVITIPGQVMFPVGKSELMKSSQTQLDRVVSALKDQGDRQIVVEGHTDSQGSETMNQDLSQRRAEAVRDYLISKGVDEDHVKAVGAGEADPIASNATAAGRATNRRVEIIVRPGQEPQGQGEGQQQPPDQPSR